MANSSRAKRRWGLLAAAIKGGAADESIRTADDLVVYAIPGLQAATLLLHQQPQRSLGSSLDHLVSHRLHDGLDNTGNVRIWPAEDALLAWCLRQRPAGYFGGKRVLELGAGMAGLAGLGIACYADPPPAEVVLSDGHPHCLAALEACVALNRARLRCPVRVQRLVWGECDRPAAAAAASVDIVLGADLLFFERFHGALLELLGALLAPETGVAWLLQPSRGGALERFAARAQAEGTEDDETGGWEAVEEAAAGLVEAVEGDRLRLLRVRRRKPGGRRA